MKNNNSNKNVPALTRGLKVLELLAEEESELSLKSIAERLSIPIPSLWRILGVLRGKGYLLFDEDKKTYRLGFKFLYLGNVFMSRMGFRSQARGYLKKLMELTGETAELSARVKDQLILIEQVEGPEAVRLFSRIGSAYPYFHATAPGKVYLAHMTGEKLKRVMDRMGLPRITEHTITDFQVLEKELKAFRKNGYSLDEQEMRIGVVRIAAPVYDKKGKVVACLGVAAPSFRITAQNRDKIGKWSKKLAQELSTELQAQTGGDWLA
jgi:DNA-binding IclR family transcriptional regulator